MVKPRQCDVCQEGEAIVSQWQDAEGGLVERRFCAACASVTVDQTLHGRREEMRTVVATRAAAMTAEVRRLKESGMTPQEILREMKSRFVLPMPPPSPPIIVYQRPYRAR